MGVNHQRSSNPDRMILHLLLIPSCWFIVAMAENMSETLDYVLLSTGSASAYQGSTLGVYSVIPEEPGIYEQKGGDYYMYKDKDTWYISSRLTNCDKSHTLGCGLCSYLGGLHKDRGSHRCWRGLVVWKRQRLGY